MKIWVYWFDNVPQLPAMNLGGSCQFPISLIYLWIYEFIDWLPQLPAMNLRCSRQFLLLLIYLWIYEFIDWLISTCYCYEPRGFFSVPFNIHLSVKLWVDWLTHVPGMSLGFYFQLCSIIYKWIYGSIDVTCTCYEPRGLSSVPFNIYLSVNLWVYWLIDCYNYLLWT